jgi:acyl-CoA thioester hydrolase
MSSGRSDDTRTRSLFFDFRLHILDFRLPPMSVFQFSHRVTYAECTVGNHIYYARYLDLLEAARGGFFRHLDATFLQWQEKDTIFPVVECRLRYKSPARYDDVLTIEVWVTSAEKVRLNFAYRILNQIGVLILEAETFHVCTGLDEKPKRLPEDLRERLKAYLQAA